MKKKSTRYVITIRVTSRLGTEPNVRTLCGDTVALSLSDGQTASFSVKKITKKKPVDKLTK